MGKEKLLFAARDGLRGVRGRTALLSATVPVEPLLLPGAMALLHQVRQAALFSAAGWSRWCCWLVVSFCRLSRCRTPHLRTAPHLPHLLMWHSPCAALYRLQVKRYDLVIQLSEEGAALGARDIRNASRDTMKEFEQDMALATALAQVSGSVGAERCAFCRQAGRHLGVPALQQA